MMKKEYGYQEVDDGILVTNNSLFDSPKLNKIPKDKIEDVVTSLYDIMDKEFEFASIVHNHLNASDSKHLREVLHALFSDKHKLDFEKREGNRND